MNEPTPVVESVFFESPVFDEDGEYYTVIHDAVPMSSLREAVMFAAERIRHTVAVATICGSITLVGLAAGLSIGDATDRSPARTEAAREAVPRPTLDRARATSIMKQRAAFASKFFVHTPHPTDDSDI